MGTRNIRKDDDPILRKKSRVVEKFDERLFTLLDDMAETMYLADGVGLAAVQVGVLRRVVVIDVGEGIIELINPEIVESDGAQCEEEGCLSLPGRNNITFRPMSVTVRAQNREGKWCMYKGDGLKARAFCHELDHLDGVLFIDRIATQEQIEENPSKEEEAQ